METNSALASLTATYTDSEGEDHHMDEDTDASTESQVIIPPRPATKALESVSGTGDVANEPKPKKKKLKNPKKSLRLVSYNDDTIVSDGEGIEEEEEEDEEESDDEEGSGANKDAAESSMEITEETVSRSIDPDDRSKTGDGAESEKEDRWAKYGFNLPPEPKNKCPAELQGKINILYEKMRDSNMDMSRVIQKRKEFRNPSIYEKLIQFCDINEFGTNYPPELYDPLQWGPESFYEELAKTQKVEMDRREKEKKDNSKVELALAAAKKVEEEAKRRKSKWDQPGPSSSSSSAASGSAGSVKPAGIIQPPLTTSISGTKGTVISAFGSLPKKPKV